jgi:hypothetical protein
MVNSSIYIHLTAQVPPEANMGAGTRIWNQAQIREEEPHKEVKAT